MLCDWESVFWGSSLFSVGKRKLRKIGPRGNTGGEVRTIAGPWEGRRGLLEKLAVKFPALELKAGETSELSLKSSTQIGQVDRSAGRQVAKSASLGPRKVLRED